MGRPRNQRTAGGGVLLPQGLTPFPPASRAARPFSPAPRPGFLLAMPLPRPGGAGQAVPWTTPLRFTFRFRFRSKVGATTPGPTPR
jgi:hypothetical protein